MLVCRTVCGSAGYMPRGRASRRKGWPLARRPDQCGKEPWLETATDKLGRDFWTWRASEQPRSLDDIPRITRPAGWRPRWSLSDVEGYRADVARFASQLGNL